MHTAHHHLLLADSHRTSRCCCSATRRTTTGNLAFPLLLVGGLFLLSRRSGGAGGMGGPGGNNPLAFGKSKARFQMEPNTGVTFEDVAGVEEAKQDFMEVSDCCCWCCCCCIALHCNGCIVAGGLLMSFCLCRGGASSVRIGLYTNLCTMQ